MVILSASGSNNIYMYGVVPENIHTCTMEGIGNSRGVRGQRSLKFQKGGWFDGRFIFQMSFDSIQIQLLIELFKNSFLTHLVDFPHEYTLNTCT